MENGQLLFSAEEKKQFLSRYPDCEKLFRPFVGSREFLNETDFSRYCLWLDGVNPAEYTNNTEIMKRIRAVREYRASNKIPRIRKTADSPQLFTQIRQPENDYIIIPRVSSARRKYIPIGYVSRSVVASDAVVIVDGASMFDFGLLMSQTHNAWMRTVAGRLKNDYRYAPSVYYNFPYPDADQDDINEIEERAKAVIKVRSNYPDCSLATLYGADSFFLFNDLVKAHSDLDAAVESAYGMSFDGDEEKIVAHLFSLYAEKVGE